MFGALQQVLSLHLLIYVAAFASLGGAFPSGGMPLSFRLVHARYDRNSQRAYVELRDTDEDGGEMLATAIFSFRTCAGLADRQIEQEILRKARHLLKRAATAI